MRAKKAVSASRSCRGAGSRADVIHGAGRAYVTCPTCGKHIYFGVCYPKDASGKMITRTAVPRHLPKKSRYG